MPGDRNLYEPSANHGNVNQIEEISMKNTKMSIEIKNMSRGNSKVSIKTMEYRQKRAYFNENT